MARTELGELPYSEEAEKTVLGTIVFRPKWAGDAENLEASDFYPLAHQRIFAAIAALIEDGDPISELAVITKLPEERAYIADLMNWCSPTGITPFVKVLREKAIARAMIRNYTNALTNLRAGTRPLDVLRATDESLRQVGTVRADTRNLFVAAPDFLNMESDKTNWVVEGLIERGSNGFIVAEPKGSKSFTALALANALALGDPWLGFNIPKRVKVAAMWREDNPAMTRTRLSKLQGSAFREELRGWLWVNTRHESESFLLDDPMAVRELIVNLKRIKAEFLILDVFNILHTGDENDNTEMRKVLREATNIQNQTGCQICILHHYNKGDGKSVTQKMRGSSAISGFAEWIIGLELVDEDLMIRQAKFELKSAERPTPVYYHITNTASGGVQFRVVENYQPKKRRDQVSALFGGSEK